MCGLVLRGHSKRRKPYLSIHDVRREGVKDRPALASEFFCILHLAFDICHWTFEIGHSYQERGIPTKTLSKTIAIQARPTP
jgi:hypothetical protein